MKGELLYARNPWRSRILWVAFYLLFVGILIFFTYKVTSKIRTHTLPVGEVHLKIPYSKYLLGEPVTFLITNNYNSPIFFTNNCPNEPLAVYRFENNKWQRLHDKVSPKDCPEEQRQVSVPARGLVNGTFEPWHHLFDKPGKYRVVAFVEYYNALPYQDFEVIAKPKLVNSSSSGGSSAANTAAGGNTSGGQSPAVTQTPPVYTAKQTRTITSSGGSITVQYDNSYIYVTKIAPAAGCTFEGGNSGPQVEVTFKCGGSEVQIQLNISNGQLLTQIEQGN